MRKKLIMLFAIALVVMDGDIHAFDLENEWGTIDIHGFISQGFLKSDRNNFYAKTEDGTFRFNE